MALQRSPIDGAAVNSAALVVQFAAAVLLAAGSVSASAFRNTPITASAQGSAAIPASNLWQNHSAAVNAIQPATVWAYSSVVKQGGSSATASALFTARHMPAFGGAEIDASSTFTVNEATLKTFATASSASGAAFTSTAYRWLYDAPILAATGELIGEPGIKLSGHSYWTFEASARKVGFGQIGFTAGGIRILNPYSALGGSSTFTNAINYKRRVTSSGVCTSTLAAPVAQKHKVTAVTFPTSGATFTATGVRYAKVSSTFSVPGSMTAVGYGFYSQPAAFPAQVGFASSAYAIRFHGYPVLAGVGLLEVTGPHVFSMVSAEPMGWASCTMSAETNIRATDSQTWLRPPEERDFIRAPETRDFLRSI